MITVLAIAPPPPPYVDAHNFVLWVALALCGIVLGALFQEGLLFFRRRRQ
jgi:hypothetical protein